MHVQTKTTLTVLVSTITCLGIYAAFTIDRLNQLQLDAAIAQLTAVAESRVSEIEELVGSYREKTILVATQPGLRDLIFGNDRIPKRQNRARMFEILDSAIKSDPTIKNISIFDSNGSTIASTKSPENDPTKQQPSTNGEYLNPVSLPENRGKSAVSVAVRGPDLDLIVYVPVFTEDRFGGAVAIEFSSTAFDRMIRNAGFSRTGQIVLALRDRHGRRLIINRDGHIPEDTLARVAQHDLHRIPVLQALAGQDQTMTRDAYRHDGTRVIAVTRSLPDLNLGLAAQVNASEVFEMIAIARNGMLGVAVSLVLLSLVGGHLMGKPLQDTGTRLKSELRSRMAAERRFVQMFDSAPTAMLMIDKAGCIVHANRQSEKLLGYSHGKLLRMKVEQLCPAHIRHEHEALRSGYAKAPTTRAMGANRNLNALRIDGSEVPVEIGLTPIDTDKGPMVLASLVDLSGRKAAEDRFSRMFASAPTAMLIIAADGHIRHANQQAEKLLGYERDSLLHQKVEQLVPEDIRGGHEALRSRYAASPTTRAMGANRDLHALRRDGTQVPVEIGLTPINTDEGSMVIVALVDLSERQMAESKLRERADALARSNRELDDFAYVASHDLKAPLRGIDQLASFILEDAASVLPEESLDDLHLLRNRVTRMEKLLDGLLEYSRIGREEARPEQLDTKSVILEAAELYVPADRFRVEIPDNLPPIFAPRIAADIAFRNVLMNAVKHHDKEQGVIRIGWKRDNDYVRVLISDDGPGIQSIYREKIFGLFQTLQARDRIESSGIGLALVKKTLESHGGMVDLVPNEDRGACFRLSWKVNAEEHQKAA